MIYPRIVLTSLVQYILQLSEGVGPNTTGAYLSNGSTALTTAFVSTVNYPSGLHGWQGS